MIKCSRCNGELELKRYRTTWCRSCHRETQRERENSYEAIYNRIVAYQSMRQRALRLGYELFIDHDAYMLKRWRHYSLETVIAGTLSQVEQFIAEEEQERSATPPERPPWYAYVFIAVLLIAPVVLGVCLALEVSK